MAVTAAIGVAVGISQRADASAASNCDSGGGSSRSPVTTTTTPPADVLSRFAVLRRAQGPGDQLSGIRDFSVSDLLAGQLASYQPLLTRLLAPAPGGGYYLITGTTPTLRRVPSSCYIGLTRTRRRLAHQLENFMLARAGQPGYCLVHATSSGTRRIAASATDSTCATFADNASVFALGGKSHGSRRSVYGLVPDGVARVELTFRADPTITAPVNGNFFLGSGSATSTHRILRAQGKLERRVSKRSHPTAAERRKLQRLFDELFRNAVPAGVDWLDQSGAVVTRFEPPTGPLGLIELALASA